MMKFRTLSVSPFIVRHIEAVMFGAATIGGLVYVAMTNPPLFDVQFSALKALAFVVLVAVVVANHYRDWSDLVAITALGAGFGLGPETVWLILPAGWMFTLFFLKDTRNWSLYALGCLATTVLSMYAIEVLTVIALVMFCVGVIGRGIDRALSEAPVEE